MKQIKKNSDLKTGGGKKKRNVIILVILCAVILIPAIFFAQKYTRLYLKFMDFEDYQYYLSQRNEFYGENNKIEDWSFGRYLQYLDEAKGAEEKALEEQEKLLDVYRQDTVGGKTPEETLAGFVDALKKKDFDLASKFMILEEQEIFKDELEGHSEENINKMIGGLENAPAMWKKETGLASEDYANYYYMTEIEGEKLPVVIEFQLNSYSQVWKIVSF